MRKFISHIISVPALALLTIGLILLALALSIAGGSKGLAILDRAIHAFTDHLKV